MILIDNTAQEFVTDSFRCDYTLNTLNIEGVLLDGEELQLLYFDTSKVETGDFVPYAILSSKKNVYNLVDFSKVYKVVKPDTANKITLHFAGKDNE